MATVLAQVIVTGIMLLGIFVQKKENVLKGLRLFVKIPLEYVEGICKIGIPTALQGMAYCFISMILTRMVAGFGPEAIATQRVGGQIESISWNTADGFGAAMNAFIGQNYGAGKTERVKKGYRVSLWTVGIWGLLITFVEREAAAYDEQAVMENKQRKMRKEGMTLPCGCPGSQSRNIQRQDAPAVETPQAQQTSRLSQWPVQIKLVPVNAPYFDGARLLIAADCTAYAYAAFHERFIKGHITLVGCPKLDGVDYSEKLTEIIRENDIKSVTVVRMEVPCCGGLELAAKKALQQSGKFIPWQVVTVTVDGRLVEE